MIETEFATTNLFIVTGKDAITWRYSLFLTTLNNFILCIKLIKVNVCPFVKTCNWDVAYTDNLSTKVAL